MYILDRNYGMEIIVHTWNVRISTWRFFLVETLVNGTESTFYYGTRYYMKHSFCKILLEHYGNGIWNLPKEIGFWCWHFIKEELSKVVLFYFVSTNEKVRPCWTICLLLNLCISFVDEGLFRFNAPQRIINCYVIIVQLLLIYCNIILEH